MFRDKKCSHCPLLGLLKWLFRSLILQPSLLLIHPALWSHHDFMKSESDHISALGKRKHMESSGTRSRMWSCLEKCDPCMSTSHGLLENSDFGKGPYIPQSLQGRLSWWAEKWKGPGKQFLKTKRFCTNSCRMPHFLNFFSKSVWGLLPNREIWVYFSKGLWGWRPTGWSVPISVWSPKHSLAALFLLPELWAWLRNNSDVPRWEGASVP